MKTIDYIQLLHKDKKGCHSPEDNENEVWANCENPHEEEDQVSGQVKFNVFQGITDTLSQSFNASISVTTFQELYFCVFSCTEERCEPQTLQETMTGDLHQLKNRFYWWLL